MKRKRTREKKKGNLWVIKARRRNARHEEKKRRKETKRRYGPKSWVINKGQIL
jgi:hypothetical protein